MIFSSLIFLFVYLPIVLGIYYVTPLRYRNLFLLIANLFFYGFGEPVYILIMISSILIDYTHGLLVEKYRDNDRKARRLVLQSVLLNLGLLFFFKYFNPMGIPLPIGISFYTFQTMSYTIDIYRNDARPQNSMIDFGVYVTLFPQLIAGPIVKYKDLSEQLVSRKTTLDSFSSGIYLFVFGLFKKVCLANNIGLLWTTYQELATSNLSLFGAWLGIVSFAFQIYFDFSGYSDMARGLGRMLGFEFLENFNFPYIAKSATEFWRRWHISLGSWFRDYVYIPLGGNQRGLAITCRNLLLVWIATGIWHGASWNFALWGLYYAIILILEKLFLLDFLQRIPAFCSHIYAIFVVLIGWCIFAIEDSFAAIVAYLSVMFGANASAWISSSDYYYIGNYGMILVLCVLFSLPITNTIWSSYVSKVPQWVQTIFTPLLLLCTLIISTAYLVDANYNPFLYFRF